MAKKVAKKAKKPAKMMKPKIKAKAKTASKVAKVAKVAKGAKVNATGQKLRNSSKPKNVRSLSYTQSEVLENIRAFCGLTKRSEAKEIGQDIAAFLMDSLKRGYKVPFLGLGKLYVRNSKARMGRNPATGEVIQISPRKRVRFSASKTLKQAVL